MIAARHSRMAIRDTGDSFRGRNGVNPAPPDQSPRPADANSAPYDSLAARDRSRSGRSGRQAGPVDWSSDPERRGSGTVRRCLPAIRCDLRAVRWDLLAVPKPPPVMQMRADSDVPVRRAVQMHLRSMPYLSVSGERESPPGPSALRSHRIDLPAGAFVHLSKHASRHA